MPEVQVGGHRMHDRDAGEGPPVLLLHSWPTSSLLYRDVMKPIAEHNRVLARHARLRRVGQAARPSLGRAKTMARVKAQLPQAEVTALPQCGHFLQEDAPAEIGAALAEFFRP